MPPDQLIAAAKSARLSQIDDRRDFCGDDRTVADWLREVTGPTARSIRWKGGRCVLARKDNPIDVGMRWCAHAEITPRRGGKAATIEVYFEKPVRGRPGVPFAFRSNVFTSDGWDYGRFTRDFEMNWRSTYEPGFTRPGEDCD